MQWKHTAVVTGATLIGAWVAGTPQAPRVIATPPAAQVASGIAAAEASSNIEEEARRLQARVGRHLADDALPASRNPFRFREAPPARSADARATRDREADSNETETPDEKPLVLPEPPLKLIGMATDEVGGTPKRTAVVSTTQGVVLAGVGDTVAGYRVLAVEADAVELSGMDGGTRRLVFKP